jgi:signal recognition particle GTPase
LAYHEDEDPTNKAAIIQRSKSMRSGAQKNKLIIIMVGLPGRGKTFLCNKLKCYLNWCVPAQFLNHKLLRCC